MNTEGSLETLAVRLKPCTDVRQEIQAIANRERIGAGFVLAAVGSLSTTCLRFANQNEPAILSGKQEVLTLSGTLGTSGVHLHMTIADSNGHCLGGHVLDGCEVYTTLELVLGIIPGTRFLRIFDRATGFRELDIQSMISADKQDDFPDSVSPQKVGGE